mmetsp:Transcript_18534/g.39902  ORF Transcript_18534/g.39902 Transcript_18534/m.39902 type:complete len:80 (-) Transcript_18534:58-297(-)
MPHMLCTLLMRRHTERPKSRRNADFAVVNSNERPEMQARMEWSFEQLIPSAQCLSSYRGICIFFFELWKLWCLASCTTR